MISGAYDTLTAAIEWTFSQLLRFTVHLVLLFQMKSWKNCSTKSTQTLPNHNVPGEVVAIAEFPKCSSFDCVRKDHYIPHYQVGSIQKEENISLKGNLTRVHI
ncbi:hypothetical protein CFP56_021252 [Quercus suber]|uniref:Uncharacterized protein n=1 Tax=Quercus suber TaxID=58331 RepID=A0AAW0KFW5_QUESU